jgi:endo-1,4-beta-mannosidase
MYWWSSFDASEVREEFKTIAGLGLGLVRIFLLWEDWQPTPSRVDQQALANLEQVCDIAAELGLQLDVTFFTGHMSGPSWVPAWMLRWDKPVPVRVRQVVSKGEAAECGYANPYSDPETIRAAELLLNTVVTRLKDHAAIGLWNLGNEPDLFAWPKDVANGRAWVRRMTNLIRRMDPAHPVTCGLHTRNLLEDNGLRVHDVFAEVDTAVMHGYPMYLDWARDPLDPDLVPFLCALISALCGKPTLMEEFGGCTVGPGKPSSVWKWISYGKARQQFMASEEALVTYIEQVLPRLVEVGALGAVIWCYADYAPRLYDRPPCDESWHERFFGLVRPDGSLKPHAEVLKRFAATKPTVQPASRQVILDVSAEAYYLEPLAHAQRLFASFVA